MCSGWLAILDEFYVQAVFRGTLEFGGYQGLLPPVERRDLVDRTLDL